MTNSMTLFSGRLLQTGPPVKLWAKDGTVIYSNDPTSVGERYPTKENLLRALRGENAIEIKVPQGAENERERYLGTLMEVYTPIVVPGSTEPKGAFEIYQYYEPTAQRIDELRRWIFWSIGVGSAVLYVSLSLVVWRGQIELTSLRRRTNLELEEGRHRARIGILRMSPES